MEFGLAEGDAESEDVAFLSGPPPRAVRTTHLRTRPVWRTFSLRTSRRREAKEPSGGERPMARRATADGRSG